MAHPTVEAAVRAKLKAGLTALGVTTPVYEEGMYDVPTDTSAFIVLQFPFNQNSHRTINAPGGLWYREEGGARIVIHARRKGSAAQGITAGRTWAGQIAAMFRGAEFDGIRCMAPSSPTTDDSNDEGGYFVLAFVIPYEFQFQQEG